MAHRDPKTQARMPYLMLTAGLFYFQMTSHTYMLSCQITVVLACKIVCMQAHNLLHYCWVGFVIYGSFLHLS